MTRLSLMCLERESVANHGASRVLPLTSLRIIPEESPRTRRLCGTTPPTHTPFPGGHGCSGSDFLGLAPPAIIRVRLHLRSSLCLRGDVDTDKDDAAAAAASFPSALRLGAGAEQSEPGAGGVSLLRGEFIKDSSNMDELRVSTLLEAVFFNTENGGIAAR